MNYYRLGPAYRERDALLESRSVSYLPVAYLIQE